MKDSKYIAVQNKEFVENKRNSVPALSPRTGYKQIACFLGTEATKLDSRKSITSRAPYRSMLLPPYDFFLMNCTSVM